MTVMPMPGRRRLGRLEPLHRRCGGRSVVSKRRQLRASWPGKGCAPRPVRLEIRSVAVACALRRRRDRQDTGLIVDDNDPAAAHRGMPWRAGLSFGNRRHAVYSTTSSDAWHPRQHSRFRLRQGLRTVGARRSRARRQRRAAMAWCATAPRAIGCCGRLRRDELATLLDALTCRAISATARKSIAVRSPSSVPNRPRALHAGRGSAWPCASSMPAA